MKPFATLHLADAHLEPAPDGSQVRVLLRLDRGGMAQFLLPAGAVSAAVAHCSVEEIWLITAGTGQMWRGTARHAEIVPLSPGTCVSIPAGTGFQFRAAPGEPLVAVAVTMPPWPGGGEAVPVVGPWTTSSA
ncbi:MAG: cupin domain-containing protein [Betaproteobacteria bacterium]|nr:cupin domain-containing protein [Betaproteobacteria bacterium]